MAMLGHQSVRLCHPGEALKLQPTAPRTNISEANIWASQREMSGQVHPATKLQRFLFRCHPTPIPGLHVGGGASSKYPG